MTNVFPEAVRAHVERCVDRGIDRLGKPQRWLKKINLETLDVQSPQKCALAQVYGSFERGASALGLMSLSGESVDADKAAALGFAIGGPYPVSWALMSDVWHEKLKALKERHAALA